jgi:hypothetical protein
MSTDLSIRAVPMMPDSTRSRDDIPNLSTTPRRMIDPSEYHQLSPLDALAAQGRLLNRRLNEQGASRDPPVHGNQGGHLDDSVFPKFGLNDGAEERVQEGRRHRIPGKRREGAYSDTSGSRPASPTEALSLEALSLTIPEVPRTMALSSQYPREDFDLSRSVSQASSSSQQSLSTSSDGSLTPTEQYHATRIYQPPPKLDPPRLRPIIKTQQLDRPASPKFPLDTDNAHSTSPRIFSPDSANTLDRPRLPSLRPKPISDSPSQTPQPPTQRAQSINFSRPYSSRSSQYSETFSTYEVDYFTQPKSAAESRLSVPGRSPDSESVISSPGLGEEEYGKLPRGRRKSRPTNDMGVFFRSTSMKSFDAAHRWPVTPTSSGGDRAFFPSPPSTSGEGDVRMEGLGVGGRTWSTRTVSGTDIPPVPARPKTSGSIIESSARQKRVVSAEVIPPRRPSQVSSSTKPRYTLHPPVVAPQEPFNSPTQILHPSKSTSSLVVAQPNTLSPEDHATLGIKFHEQNLLPQATHHFQLSAEGGSPTGMLLYSLSLRHAWGCAANPAKAVEWLHAAAECASASVDENGVKRPGGIKDLAFKSEDGKRRSAMLALAIYELGQSYMNGWGVEKDKYLALRCYEISANFGDTDGQW